MKRTYKTRGAARVVSRNADHIDYNLSNRAVIGGKQPVGAVSIRQAVHGTYSPTIQGAVDDLITMIEMPIGGCMLTWDDITPNGQPQSQLVTISGTLAAQEPGNTQAVVHVYGFPFKFAIGTTPNVITSEVIRQFKQLAAENSYFQTVTQQDPTSFEVTFIDNQSHEIYSNVENGVTVVSSVTSPAVYGYGNWDLVGSETKFTKTLNYFRRIG